MLDAAVPSSATLSQTETGRSDDCCWFIDRSYTIDGCDTRYVDNAPAAYEVEYVERSGQQVVYWEPDVWNDGVCVGEVEAFTFERVGDCANPDSPPPI